MIGLLFDSADFVAQRAGCWLEGADGVVRLEVAPVRAQLSLPLTSLVVLHTSHAQLPHHRLSKWLRGEFGVRERLAANRTVSRPASVLRQTLAAHSVA